MLLSCITATCFCEPVEQLSVANHVPPFAPPLSLSLSLSRLSLSALSLSALSLSALSLVHLVHGYRKCL